MTDPIPIDRQTSLPAELSGRRSLLKRRAAGGRYDAVVGLGAACQVAEQCRRHLGAAPGVPFDWIITPFEAIERILSDMGAGLGQRFISVRGGTSIQCANYGVLYEHDFQHDENGQVVFDADYIAACRSRMAHKMQTLTDILSSRKKVLFIRAYSSVGVDGDRLNDATFTSADLNHLVKVIRRRAPGLMFDLLFIHSPDRVTEKIDLSGPLSSSIIVREMRQPPGMDWYGIDADWIALFQNLGLMKPQAEAPATERPSPAKPETKAQASERPSPSKRAVVEALGQAKTSTLRPEDQDYLRELAARIAGPHAA